MPLGSIGLPFSLLIGISLIFLILGTIGVADSRKLGKQYIFRGIRLIIPVAIIIVVIMMLGAIPFQELANTGDASININQVIGSISGSPIGGQQVVTLTQANGDITFQWGLGLGGFLLLLSGIILLVAGVFEQISKADLFSQRTTTIPPKESKEDNKE
jgi:hypothetical protein